VEFDTGDALVLLALLTALTGLMALAPAIRVPYPILLVLGGLALGFVPGAPELELPPDLVLVGVLPPLLYAAAFFTSLRELRTNVRSISLLALGLVVATMAVVAVVAHEAVGLPWAPAFVLGAVVAPTDPLAATAIARRLGVPRRVITLVEGESLVNDATALVLYRTAVVAAVAGSFSLWDASIGFVLSAAGGVAVGLAVGAVVAFVRIRLDNIPAEIAISLLTGYLAFIPAVALHASGVLAAVTVGVYLGWRSPELSTPAMRMQGTAVWETVQFLVNALLFGLVGLQLRPILDDLSSTSTGELLVDAILVTATVVVVRLAFVAAFAHGPVLRRVSGAGPAPSRRETVVVGWMGLRGAVSLAAALAIPLETDAGAPFPDREIIVFIAFAVILGTLVVQGLSLPLVIRLLALEDDGGEAREEAKARLYAADAALARLEELLDEDWVREDTATRMRGLYRFRRDRFASRFDDADDGAIERRSVDYQRLRRELLEAERAAVVALRSAGRISDDVMRRVERDLDLEDVRLDV
jgi:monovalent cation/hydrogen antiporter